MREINENLKIRQTNFSRRGQKKSVLERSQNYRFAISDRRLWAYSSIGVKFVYKGIKGICIHKIINSVIIH
jgi:hypothetical protein